MTANASPFTRPTSSFRRAPVRPIVDRVLDRAGDPEIRREQVGGACRYHGDPGLRADDRVDAALHHPVAAPHEDQVRTRLQRPANLLRRLAALRHLGPERVVDAMPRERAAKLGQTAAERLAGVRDDRDPGHEASRPSRRSTRVATSAIANDARPMSAPDATSIGWCMPRYMREDATTIGSRTASVQPIRVTHARRATR